MAYPTPSPAAYLQASVQTASPARLLIMLYDRLALDCQRALAAQESGDHAEAHEQLDRKSTRLNSSHTDISRMPSSA